MKADRDQPYRLRVSARAKRVILKVSPADGLEVVIPQGFDPAKVPAIVAEKKAWIDKVQQRFDHQWLHAGESKIPDSITFQAVNRNWSLEKRPRTGRNISLRDDDHRLLLKGDPGQEEVFIALLQEWLKDQGRVFLIPWLYRVSRETGLSYTRATIRRQKSRWGSCSSRKSISLNCKLLFFPPNVVRYILIHELCHTLHMNHSSEFWGLVSSFAPDYSQLDREANAGWRFVPPWAL